MKLLRESLLVLALGLTLSSASAPSESVIVIEKHALPWHAWNNPVVKPHFTWPEFRKKVAELNKLPDTDYAFERLRRGTVLRIPALPGTTASASDIARAKKQQLDLDEARFKVEKDAWHREKETLKAELEARGLPLYKNFFFYLAVVCALLAGGTVVHFVSLQYYKVFDGMSPADMRKLKADATHMRHQLRESETRDHFLQQYTHAFEVPDDIGKVFGKMHLVYLLKAEPIEGDPAVQVFGESFPVKVKNLKRFFYEARSSKPHVLKYYHIVQVEKEADTVATGRL